VEAIATVFRRFAELSTGREVLLSLCGDGLLLPRQSPHTGGAGSSMRHRRHRGNVSNCCVRSCPRSLSPSMPQSGRPRCEIIWHGGGCTALEMTLTKTGGHFRATDEDTAAAAPARRTAGRPGDGLSAILPRVPASCLPLSVRRRWLICAACEWHAPSRSTECRSFALELHASICTDLKGDFHSHFLTVSALCLRP
jgi:hypothetical protein